MTGLLLGLLALATFVYAAYTSIIIRGLLKKDSDQLERHTPSVSVIIAARNEAENLPDLLQDLSAQSYPGKLDIYIADDRSTDGSWSILNQHAAHHPQFHPLRITQLSTQMTPKKNALTECLKRSTAEIILTTDADCRMGPNWVSSAVARMDERTGILVGYSQVMAQTLFQKLQALDFIGIMVANAGMLVSGYHWSGSGQNLAYRRSAFTQIGGFNPVAAKISGDDVYLVQTIPSKTELTAKFNFDPDHFVQTRPMENLRAFLVQRTRWASNSRGLERSDPLFFWFLVSAFIANLSILLCVLSASLGSLFWLMVGLKFLAEGTVVSLGARRFGYGNLIGLFPFWFLAQPLYISYIGLMGVRGKFSWKP